MFIKNIRTTVACATATVAFAVAPAMASPTERECSYVEIANLCPTIETVENEKTIHINLNHGDQFVWAHIGEETLYVSYVGDKRRVLHGIARMIDTETDAVVIADYTAIMEAIEKNKVFPFDAVMAFSDDAEVPQYLEQMKVREREQNRERLMSLFGIPSPNAALAAQAIRSLVAPRCPDTGCQGGGAIISNGPEVQAEDESEQSELNDTVAISEVSTGDVVFIPRMEWEADKAAHLFTRGTGGVLTRVEPDGSVTIDVNEIGTMTGKDNPE